MTTSPCRSALLVCITLLFAGLIPDLAAPQDAAALGQPALDWYSGPVRWGGTVVARAAIDVAWPIGEDAVLVEGSVTAPNWPRAAALRGIYVRATRKLILFATDARGSSRAISGLYEPATDAFHLALPRDPDDALRPECVLTRSAPAPDTGAGLTIDRAVCDPGIARPGDAIRLEVDYTVTGPDGDAPITERIEVATREGVKGQKAAQRVARLANGTRQVKAIYELRAYEEDTYQARVELSGTGLPMAEKAVFFEVKGPAPTGNVWERGPAVVRGRVGPQGPFTPGVTPPNMKLSGSSVIVTDAAGQSNTVKFEEPATQVQVPGLLTMRTSCNQAKAPEIYAMFENSGDFGLEAATGAWGSNGWSNVPFNPPGTDPLSLKLTVWGKEGGGGVEFEWTYRPAAGSGPNAPDRKVAIADVTPAAAGGQGGAGQPDQPPAPPDQPQVADLGQPVSRGVAMLPAVDGTVEVRGPDGAWRPVQPGEEIGPNTAIRTGPGGRAVICFPGGALVLVGESTTTSVQTILGGDGAQESGVGLSQGKTVVASSGEDAPGAGLIVTTPTASLAPTGTAFVVGYDPNTRQTTASTYQGQVLVSPTAPGLQPLTLDAGLQVEVTPDAIGSPRPIDQAGDEHGPGITSDRHGRTGEGEAGQHDGGHTGDDGTDATGTGVVELKSLGVEIALRDGLWTVVKVIWGDYAAEGDHLIRIGATDTKGLTQDQALELLAGPAGSRIRVQFRTPDHSRTLGVEYERP